MLVHWYRGYLTFVCALLTCGTVSAKTIGWVGNLIRHARNDIRVNQVLLLSDQRKGIAVSEEEEVAYKISRKLPTWEISFQEATMKKAEDLSLNPSFFNLHETTLFLVTHTSKENWNLSLLNGPIEFMRRIAEPGSRAKCVILLPQEKKHADYDLLLRFMWSKQFLDVTILELPDDGGHNAAMVHSFNPFTNTTTKVEYSSRVDWFPDKTRDLHGHEMKVGVFPQPFSTNLQLNDTGHIVSASGDEVLLVEAFSEAMNFKTLWVQSKEKQWGDAGCTKEEFTGLIRGIIHNEVNLIANQPGVYGACEEIFYAWSVSTKQYKLSWVIPVIPGKSSVLSFEWKLFNSMCLLALFITTWVIARLLPFDKRNWKSLYMLQIVLGSSTPREPQRLAERIVFGSLLISCMMYSSHIFTAFTDVGMHHSQEVELKTMEQLGQSNFVPVMHSFTYKQVYPYARQSVRRLLDKATPQIVTYDECLKRLLKTRNITCLVRADLAEVRIRQNRDANNDPLMKIVDESFRVGSKAMIYEPSSPYASRLNRIISRLWQSGLLDKWERLNVDDLNSTAAEDHEDEILEEMKSEPILKKIVVVLVLAYTFSCIVFICELLVFHVKKQHFERLYECVMNFVRFFYIRKQHLQQCYASVRNFLHIWLRR